MVSSFVAATPGIVEPAWEMCCKFVGVPIEAFVIDGVFGVDQAAGKKSDQSFIKFLSKINQQLICTFYLKTYLFIDIGNTLSSI